MIAADHLYPSPVEALTWAWLTLCCIVITECGFMFAHVVRTRPRPWPNPDGTIAWRRHQEHR